jgi:hypothetical protein
MNRTAIVSAYGRSRVGVREGVHACMHADVGISDGPIVVHIAVGVATHLAHFLHAIGGAA